MDYRSIKKRKNHYLSLFNYHFRKKIHLLNIVMNMQLLYL